MMSDEAQLEAGEIHVIYRNDGSMEISSNFPLPELYLALEHIQKMILEGELSVEGI